MNKQMDQRKKRMPKKPKGLTPQYLRCKYRTNPMGIDVLKPRLSWIIESNQRAQKQTGYQILVARSEETLRNDIGDLWDTDRVKSDATAHVAYKGKRLKSRMTCYWKVRVWDKDGKVSGWSKVAKWVMGLLDETDWQAGWIGYDAPVRNAELAASKAGLVLPPPRYLRKSFWLRKPVQKATVYLTALGLCDLHINGERVGDEYFIPGWTDYNIRVYYHTYDVTELLHQGDNAIGMILADGWYAGYIGWGKNRNLYGKKTRLCAQLEVVYDDGSIETVATGKSWKASTGPLQEADFLMGETYDARNEIPGWDTPDFNDSDWSKVNFSKALKMKIQAFPGVPVRKFAELKPVGITEPKKGTYVFDLGQNFAGIVRLRINERRGKKIVLRFAEMLNPDGTVYTTNLRSARATDTYICRGGGKEIWEPRFTFHGFQYVEVTGSSCKPNEETITGLAISSDAPVTGSFKCSDSIANKLYSNICWTQRANFIEIPTDCPQRDERLGWTGDAQIYIRTATFNTDVSVFFTKWLVDLEDGQLPNGAFPDVAPRKGATDGGSAAWGDAGIICPWTIYTVYGDKQILSKQYKSMARWITYCRKNSMGLLRPDEGYGDWLSIDAVTPKDVLATAYFAYSTKLMEQIARVLEKKSDRTKFRNLFQRIKTAFDRAYISKDGRIKGDTQTAYVLALAFDLLADKKRDLAVDYLVEDIKERGWRLSTGFVGTKDLMSVLSIIGRNDVAYRLFHSTAFPSWGFSIRHGATSIWERWDGWTPDGGFQDPGMNSFAHYAFGAVGEWMFRTIGGIDTDGQGFKRITIRPRPGGKLKSAKTSYCSIRGMIETDWRLSRTDFRLKVTIPTNTTATVYIPLGSSGNITESGGKAEKAEGVKFLRNEAGEAIYEVGSGTYEFCSQGVKGIGMAG